MKPKKIVLPTVRAPKGYHFKIVANDAWITVYLMNSTERQVGYVELHPIYPYKSKRLATHSHLDTDLRGKGFGTLLYSKAVQIGLKRGYKVRSSGGSSLDAQRVWNGKGIRQYFNIRRRESPGSYSDTWYAYAKAAKNDKAKRKGASRGSR